MKNNEVILHGECMVFAANSIPNTAQRITAKDYVIVADSETTGNHHVVDVVDGETEFYKDGETLYMKSNVDTVIRCLHAERHDEITLPAGTYEFGSQQEYDPFAAHMRRVRD